MRRLWLSYVTASLRAVLAAYAGARREQSREQKRLPKWESLGIEMREALIFVYFQGRIDSRAT